jgi:hypothetical protein
LPLNIWHWIMVIVGFVALFMGRQMRAAALELSDESDNGVSSLTPMTAHQTPLVSSWIASQLPSEVAVPAPETLPVSTNETNKEGSDLSKSDVTSVALKPILDTFYGVDLSSPAPLREPASIDTEHPEPGSNRVFTGTSISLENEPRVSSPFEAVAAQIGDEALQQSDERTLADFETFLRSATETREAQRFVRLLETGSRTDALGLVARGLLGDIQYPSTRIFVQRLCADNIGNEFQLIWPMIGDRFDPNEHTTAVPIPAAQDHVIGALITLGWRLGDEVHKAQVRLNYKLPSSASPKPNDSAQAKTAPLNLDESNSADAHLSDGPAKTEAPTVPKSSSVAGPPNENHAKPSALTPLIDRNAALQKFTRLCEAFEFHAPDSVASEMLESAIGHSTGDGIEAISMVLAAVGICQNDLQTGSEPNGDTYSLKALERNGFASAPFDELIGELNLSDAISTWSVFGEQIGGLKIAMSHIYRVGQGSVVQATLVPGLRAMDPLTQSVLQVLVQPIVAVG